MPSSDMPMPSDSSGSGGAGAYPVTSGSTHPSDGLPAVPPPPGAITTSIKYGPTIIPGGKVGAAGQLIAPDGNSPGLNLKKPCTNCYITDMKADLVGLSGATVDLPQHVMLHHLVISRTGPGLSDLTCSGQSGGASIGQRFFASGNERTDIQAPTGYGVYVSNNETWNSFTDLMNTNALPWVVYVKMTYTWVPASEAAGIKPVTPVWMDAAECNAYDNFNLPGTGGIVSQEASWTSTISGKVVGAGGHMHAMGKDVAVIDDTTGVTICDSLASSYSDPNWLDDMGMPGISGMSRCRKTDGDGLGELHVGDHLRTVANYNSMKGEPLNEVMGLTVMYVDQSS
jgi:hypothetical protein